VDSLLRAAEAEPDDALAAGLLRRALAIDLQRPDVHEQLFLRTGRAPRGAAAAAEPVALAMAHPYDPWARLRAGRAERDAGRPEAAAEHWRWALFTADLDPASARSAFLELAGLGEGPRRMAQVPVHLFADESVRAHAGWRFRLRLSLHAVSEALDPVLDTTWVPASIQSFDAADAGARLSELIAAFERRGRTNPPRGMLVLLTERYAPARGRSRKLGEAQFLGRRLIARLAEGEILSRVLAHEILHLYGAAHLSERVDSLMNPSGGEWVIRAPNAAILKQTRKRRFGPGGIERNVLPYVDLEATIDAYLAIIRANLALRRAGIQEVLGDVSTPRARAQRLRKVAQLDPHLGDVCSFTAKLLWRAQRGPEAVRLFDTAAALYGPRSPQGRASRAQADRLLQYLTRTTPTPPPP
jgi:hypothetical protein